jgi:hypothetical protein
MITNRLSAVGALFALLALSQLGLSSCTVDSLTSIPFVHRFAGTALRPGQSIEWDEVTIDSNVLPSSFGDSSAMIKSISANYQYRVFHVIVTVPDSTVPKFQVDRRITTCRLIISPRSTTQGRSRMTGITKRTTTRAVDGGIVSFISWIVFGLEREPEIGMPAQTGGRTLTMRGSGRQEIGENRTASSLTPVL